MLNNRNVRTQLEEVRKARKDLREKDSALRAIEESLLRWLDLNEVGTLLPFPAPRVQLPEAAPIKGKVLLKDAVLLVLRNRAGGIMTTEEILEAAKAMGAHSRSEKPKQVVEWIIQEATKFANAPIRKVKPHHYVWTQVEGKSSDSDSTPDSAIGGDQ